MTVVVVGNNDSQPTMEVRVKKNHSQVREHDTRCSYHLPGSHVIVPITRNNGAPSFTTVSMVLTGEESWEASVTAGVSSLGERIGQSWFEATVVFCGERSQQPERRDDVTIFT